MIICPNCHKENQDHYKFCLSCGTKLPAGGPAPFVPSPPPPAGYGGPSQGGYEPAAPPPSYPQPPQPPFASQPPPPPVVGPPPSTGTSSPPPSIGASSPTAGAPATMGPCPQCNFVNPIGFKFCGRCGGALAAAAAAPPAAAPSPPSDVGSAQTIFVGDASEVQAAAQAHQAEMRAHGHAPTAEQRAMPDPADAASDEDAPTYEGPIVGTADTASPPRFRATEPPVSPFGADRPVGGVPGQSAKLVMLGPDGQPIGERVLSGGESLDVGRESGPPWEDDAYLDLHHASLSVMVEGLHIEDPGSLNGIFLKLSERVEIQNGDQFRVGQELLLYEDLPEPTPTDDGTERMGSPNPGYWGRVSVLVDPNAPSLAFPIEGQGIAIGREHGDITFPQDGYVSGAHCRIVGDDNGVYMEDVGSSNGTYMRVRSGQIVPFGSLILIGQKLFQVERA